MDQEKFIEHSPALYDLGRDIANAYKNEIERVGAVASGDLRDFNWDVQLTENGLALVFQLPDYWREVEFGRGPTQKPQGNIVQKQIEKWIRMKGIHPMQRMGKNGPYTPSEKGLAYLIARKIHKEGFKGRHPLEHALTASRPMLDDFGREAGAILGDEMVEAILKLDTTNTKR